MNDLLKKYAFGNNSTRPLQNDNNDDKVIEQSILPRLTAEGNINTIQDVMTIIKKILDICIEDYDVTFIDEYSYTPGSTPSITYSLINRSKSEKTPIKRKKLGEIKEVVDGKYTGDVFEIYENIFDCMVEFNFFDNNSNVISHIKNKFESIIETYTGDLKLAGVSEIYFLNEVSPSVSTKSEHSPKATMIYYIELQRLESIRLSAIKSISSQIKAIVKEESKIYDILDSLTNDNIIV